MSFVFFLFRTHGGKEDTFGLDFVNETDEILESFRPYYEQPLIADRADPQQLYALQATLDEKHVYHLDEIEAFCQVFFAPKKKHSAADHARMNSLLDPAVERFKDLEEEDREAFRSQLGTFRNLYAMLAQILPFGDTDLEKHYSFIRFLLTKLPRRETGPLYNFDDEVDLQYYRLQKISEGSIELASGGELKGPTDVGTGAFHEEEVELSSLIDVLNERLGTDFTDADQLFFDQIKARAAADGEICDAAKANTKDNFKYVFDEKIVGLFVDSMDQNEEFFYRFMQEPEFQRLVKERLLDDVYEQINEEGAA